MKLVPVAARRMAIMRNGERVEVQPGEPVPEAAEWSHVKAWERMGWIRWVVAPPVLVGSPAESPAPLQVAKTVPAEVALDGPVTTDGEPSVDEGVPGEEAPKRRRRAKSDSEFA